MVGIDAPLSTYRTIIRHDIDMPPYIFRGNRTGREKDWCNNLNQIWLNRVRRIWAGVRQHVEGSITIRFTSNNMHYAS